jgi:hypothetical protein
MPDAADLATSMAAGSVTSLVVIGLLSALAWPSSGPSGAAACLGREADRGGD